MLAHKHFPASCISVAHHNCDPGIGMFFIPSANPADDMLIIKAVFLFSVGISAAELNQFAEVADGRAIPNRIAVIIRVKHAWFSFCTQQDQRIGKRLEAVINKALEALPILGIMVVDKGDRVLRPCPDQ